MLICIKQHLSNIWRSVHEKLSYTEAELKKNVAYTVYKKNRVTGFTFAYLYMFAFKNKRDPQFQ